MKTSSRQPMSKGSWLSLPPYCFGEELTGKAVVPEMRKEASKQRRDSKTSRKINENVIKVLVVLFVTMTCD